VGRETARRCSRNAGRRQTLQAWTIQRRCSRRPEHRIPGETGSRARLAPGRPGRAMCMTSSFRMRHCSGCRITRWCLRTFWRGSIRAERWLSKCLPTILPRIACRVRWPLPSGDWNTHDVAYYYDLLAPLASKLDFWETQYLHVMDDPGDLVEWYKGTGLRPFLAALSDGDERNQFLAEYLEGLERVYPRQRNGRVLFPFGRIFLVAYR
jgi:hypothetical protein